MRGRVVGKLMDRRRNGRSMFGPSYTPSGNIDIEKTLWALRHSHRPDLDLIATLRALWADAYAHGWSDGQNDSDPNSRSNPYGTKTARERYLLQVFQGAQERPNDGRSGRCGIRISGDKWCTLDHGHEGNHV